MQFNIDVKNFGKVRDAKINIRPFTVIAGPNSSGKSFVTKALYSFFNTINNDHVTSLVFSNITKIKNLAVHIDINLNRPSAIERTLLSNFYNSIVHVMDLIDDEFRVNTLSQQITGITLLEIACKDLASEFSKLKTELQHKQKYLKIQSEFDAIRNILHHLTHLTSSPNVALGEEIEKGFINELKENFQVSKLSDLKNFNCDESQEISFDFDTLGSIGISNERVRFALKHESIDYFQKLYNVVYLESPIYWKLKDSLDLLRTNKKYFHYLNRQKTESLSGVPKHFYDLLDLLKSRSKDDSFLCKSPYAEDIKIAIGGDIIVSQSGEILFKENGCPKAVNLHSTALGVTNLGIISLLLERGVISKGSYLFIDEPEVNLHPLWQKIMVETLFKLSTNDINVVIASHSIDMMKSIENIMNEHTDLVEKNHFGINQLTDKGYSVSESDNAFKRVAAIKNDLGKPFFDMFIDGEF